MVLGHRRNFKEWINGDFIVSMSKASLDDKQSMKGLEHGPLILSNLEEVNSLFKNGLFNVRSDLKISLCLESH